MPKSPASLRKRRSFTAWLKRKVASRAGTARDLSSDKEPRGVFGVPLVESIQYAHRNILYHDDNDVVHRHVGAIPIVVAKSGAYLKNNGLSSVGIFRLSGGLKRVAALQAVFDGPPYGSNIDWTDATVHDAATLFRRFLNQLPDPVIPHAYYQAFRDVMSDKNEHTSTTEQRIDAFQHLIEQLPVPHQHLLLYLLDLLNLFSRHADETKMNSANLAAVFCPAILSHPDHNTAIQYKISQAVIEFLIEFQILFTVNGMANSTSASSSTTTTTTIEALRVSTEPPPVPPLPDWATNKHGGVYAERNALPRLDMAHVNRHHGKGEDNTMPDSGTDVKTPVVPFAINSDDESTPAMSPQPAPCPKVMTQRGIMSQRGQVSQKIPKQALTSAAAVIAAVLLGTVTYRNFTLHGMLNWIVFFGGLGAYWTLLIMGIETKKVHMGKPSPPVDHEDEEEHVITDDEPAWIHDKATEAAMLQDETLMAEWGDLLKRTWRNDLSTTPASMLSRNQSSDYFTFKQDDDDEDDDDDKADGASIMTIGSRYIEDSGSDADTARGNDDDNEDWSPDVTDEDLQQLWQQFQQVEKDQEIAKELQQQEKEAERQRDEETNPFLVKPIKPHNTDEERWKIASLAVSTGNDK